jgi:hypothetical protein
MLLQQQALVYAERGQQLRLVVEDLDPEPLLVLEQAFGGEVLPREAASRGWRWRVSGKAAARVLWDTLNFLDYDEARDVWYQALLLASLGGRQGVPVSPWLGASRAHVIAQLSLAYRRLVFARASGFFLTENPEQKEARAGSARRVYNGGVPDDAGSTDDV